MDFDISEEQELLGQTVRQLLENECPLPRVREVFDGEVGHDPVLWKSLLEMGLGGTVIPEAYGGSGMEMLDLELIAEELGYGAAPGPFLGHSLAGLALLLAGSEQQKKTWLPKLASGETIGTVAFGEDAGWQPENWTLAANATLTGLKDHVPFGSLADLVIAGTAGGGLALVERGAHMKAEAIDGADRTRRLDRISFESAPCEVLPGANLATSRQLCDAALILLSADAYGSAARVLEMTVEYAKTREQFGVTLGHFQGIKHALANMAIRVDPVRFLCWYAAYAYDHIPADSGRIAALTKAHATTVAIGAAREAVELHGGYGFTWECDIQIFFKRAMFDRTFLGAPSIHRERAATLAGW